MAHPPGSAERHQTMAGWIGQPTRIIPIGSTWFSTPTMPSLEPSSAMTTRFSLVRLTALSLALPSGVRDGLAAFGVAPWMDPLETARSTAAFLTALLFG